MYIYIYIYIYRTSNLLEYVIQLKVPHLKPQLHTYTHTHTHTQIHTHIYISHSRLVHMCDRTRGPAHETAVAYVEIYMTCINTYILWIHLHTS